MSPGTITGIISIISVVKDYVPVAVKLMKEVNKISKENKTKPDTEIRRDLVEAIRARDSEALNRILSGN